MIQSVPVRHESSEAHRRSLATAINLLIPVVKSVTLTDSSTTTLVPDERMSADKTVSLIPTTVAASTETWYITKGDKTFTITHSSAATSRIFDYLVV